MRINESMQHEERDDIDPCLYFSDEEKSVVLEKGPEETDFGLHILDSQPAYITKVDTGLWIYLYSYLVCVCGGGGGQTLHVLDSQHTSPK